MPGKKFNPVVIIVLVLVVLSISVVGIGLSTYYWKKEQVIQMHGRFGIVFDAGGSGTRMYVYEYKNNNEYDQTEFMECEKKGLTNYINKTDLLGPLLKKCLDKALITVPDDVTETTPIFMKATAGMRKLRLQNEQEYNKIWATVNRILKNSSFPVRFANTMSGDNEAKYSWTTLNELLDSQKTKSLLEMGSTSLQIAFEPSHESTSDDRSKNHTEEVVINNKKHNVYLHSYLCLGKSEFVRRYYAKLIKDSVNVSNNGTNGEPKIINDPCSYKGFQVNKTKKYLWETPCVTGEFAEESLGGSVEIVNSDDFYTISGTGNFSQCQQNVIEMYTTNCSSCGMNGIYQPEAYGQFMAIGGSIYYSAKFLNLPSNFTETDFERKTKELCQTSLEKLKTLDDYSDFSLDYCLTNTFTNFLLKNVLKLNRTKPGVVEFVNKINGQKVGWTLGSIIDDKELMSNAVSLTVRGLESRTYYVILSVFVLLLLIGFAVSIKVACLRPRKYSTKPV